MSARRFSSEGGERAKNSLTLVTDILSQIDRHHLDRHSYLIAVGGGALLDVAGFAATTAHRGLRLVRIPTTTLSQADSGIGVKNGINAFGKKNFIGTFAPPYAVINDFNLLATLEPRDKRAGYAEAVKIACIRDRAFFEEIEREADKLAAFEPAAMKRLIHRCAELHLDHIATSGDPFESGSARPLDFGHWSAHKLEQLSDFQICHGEAVAVGIALDVLYSRNIGLLDAKSAERILQLLERLGFKLFADELLSADAGILLVEETVYNAQYGARHLKRSIERNVVFPLANLVATSQVKLGDFVRIDLNTEGRMVFVKEAEGALVPVPLSGEVRQ